MRKADNLPPYCAIVKKSRSLNFLDPSGSARPVTGVFYLYLMFSVQTEEHGEFKAVSYIPCSLLKLVFISRLMVMLLAVASNIFQ